MTKIFATGLTLALMALMAVSASAQSLITAQIPFAFYAGDTRLPAGSYEIEVVRRPQFMRITNVADTRAAVAFHPIPITRPQTSLQPARIVFNRYGNDFFLTEIWPPESTNGRMLLKSRHEVELARKTPPIRIESVSVSR